MSGKQINISKRRIACDYDWELDLPEGKTVQLQLTSGGIVDIYRYDGTLEVSVFSGHSDEPLQHIGVREVHFSRSGEVER